jgi:hypothetical protein
MAKSIHYFNIRSIWGVNCWLNFTLIPLKIRKIFHLISKCSSEENPHNKWSVVHSSARTLAARKLPNVTCSVFNDANSTS